MRNQYGYGAFCTWERNHIGAVRGALYSIADTIEQHSKEKYGEVCISIIMFKDELIRRAMIHDTDKFANLDMFSGYVFTSKRWEELGGPDLEYGAEEWKPRNEKANEGINTAKRHSHTNDHHIEYFKERTEMTIFPLIEMVCDWYGVSARYNDGSPVMAKFEESFDTNKCKFPNCYQRFVIDKVYGFLAKQEYEIINRISEVCKCYDKDESNLRASAPVLSHLDCDIKRFLTARKQLYDSTLESSTILAARAPAQMNFANSE